MPANIHVQQDIGKVERGGTVIGVLIENLNIKRAEWQDKIWNFAVENRYFLAIIAVVEILLTALYQSIRDLYQINTWIWALAAIVLLGSGWYWYRWRWSGEASRTLVLPVLLSAALGGIFTWQAWQIAFPTVFDPQSFGIALAELGEGGAFKHTPRVQAISDQVYEYLCRDLARQFSIQEDEQICWQGGLQSGKRRVELLRIGVVPDSQTAFRYGQKIFADVVVWGQVLPRSDGGTVVRFQVLETPDRAINPEFPVVLPVTNTATEIIATDLDLDSDPSIIKPVISQQSTIIAAFTLGILDLYERDFVEAINHLETAAHIFDKDASMAATQEGLALLYYYLGQTNHAMGRIEQGQEWLIRAQEANPQEPAISLNLALGYGSLGDIPAREQNLNLALEKINTWLETHPKDNPATYDRAIIYQIRDQYSDAILDYEAVIKEDSGYYVAYIGLGQVLAESGQLDRSLQVLQEGVERAQESGANTAYGHLNLAIVYDFAGRSQEAKEEFKQAINLSTQNEWMYFYYANFLEQQEEMDAALVTYQSMIEKARNKGWAYGVLAGFLRRRNLLEEAAENYRLAIHEQPRNSLLRTYLAEVYFEMGDMDEAFREYEEAISQGEDLFYPYASYGDALFQSGEFERASKIYELALLKEPEDNTVLLRLGYIYQILNQPDRAIDLYKRVLALEERASEEAIQYAHDRLQELGVKTR